MKKITLWFRFNPDVMDWVFNHLAYGHISGVTDLKPVGDVKQTKVWAGFRWLRKHAKLVDGKVIEEADYFDH